MSEEYLRFEQTDSPSGKTVVVTIFSVSGSYVLGHIKWYGPWRQYCFYPERGTIWNITCMNTVQNYITGLMVERKEARANANPS